jgi:hypothetical protein
MAMINRGIWEDAERKRVEETVASNATFGTLKNVSKYLLYFLLFFQTKKSVQKIHEISISIC